MNKKIAYIIAAIVVIVLIAVFAQSMSNKPSDNKQSYSTPAETPVTNSAVPQTPSNNQENQNNAQPTASQSLTMADVAKHNTPSDCYAIVGDKVYDLTAWIKQHPGGEQAIIGLCGTDGTAKFAKQHGSSANAQAALSSLFIADLNK